MFRKQNGQDGLEKTVGMLVQWLQDRAKESGTKNAVVGLSGGIDSAVVFALCVRAFPRVAGVSMPCQSSSQSLDFARELVTSQVERAPLGTKIEHVTVDLGKAFFSIVDQAEDALAFPTKTEDMRFREGALRSCLRAPVLDYIAKGVNSLVYGTGNRDEDEIFRYYQKRGDGAVDNNVLAAFHKTEVRELAAYLGVPQCIIDAKPTADLWGGEVQLDEAELGITYDEIEWVERLVDMIRMHHKLPALGDVTWQWILSVWPHGLTPPTLRQQEVICRAIDAERKTRHKAEGPKNTVREEFTMRGYVW